MSKAEQWAANQRFLDRLIQRGDNVVLSNLVRNLDEVTGAFRREITSQDIAYRLEKNSELVGRWLQYSADKRSGEGWFFKLDDDGLPVVGSIFDGKVIQSTYSSRSDAFAAYIKCEAESIRIC